MEINQHQITTKERVHVDKRILEEGNCNPKQEVLGTSKQQQQPPPSASPASPPPSSSSSPSHEFSFTISLHSSSTPVPADKTNKTPPSSFAIDLSPADDIFFHGHLLPLHLLSHLPVSPRSSTNSLDSFTLPIGDMRDDQKTDKKYCSNSDSNIIINNNHHRDKTRSSRHQETTYNDNTKGRAKSKSFSLFGFKRRKKGGFEDREEGDVNNKENNNKQHKKRLRFDVSHVIKKYVRMVRPLLFRGRRENLHFHHQPYSFSGNLSFRNKQELRGRRGEFSAPASIRTSPTNSGLLLATTTLPSSTSDSTMEELQAAIQAAIAHCKNSIAVEEKLKC